MFLYLHLVQNALALLDLYSQVSLSLQNPTHSRKLILPTLTMHAEVMLDPVCNVPVSGERRETKDWPQPPFGN